MRKSEDVEIREQLYNLLKKFFLLHTNSDFIPGKTTIPLNIPSWDHHETYEALDCLLTRRTTMGPKVSQFESLFAQYIGTKYAIMVNSGSSANLLALSILSNPMADHPFHPGDEVITPAVTWATTIYPIINCQLIPVLVDVTLETFGIDLHSVQKAISPRTRAIMPVHLMGIPCDMTSLLKLATKHHLTIIEDACEAHGAHWMGKKVGSLGDIGTFSFFFSHHMTTLEGGMLVTNNEHYAELARSLRAFGWIRELKNKEKLSKQYSHIDARFLFTNIGYNMRPTEIQGSFGIHQLPRLEKFISIRRSTAQFWNLHLKKFNKYLILPQESTNTRCVWFGYPLTVKPDAPFTRKDLMDFLEKKGVETRPLAAGNMDEQPSMRHFLYRKVGTLPNSQLIMRNSFFIGNHHGIGEAQRDAIVKYFEEFFETQINKK